MAFTSRKLFGHKPHNPFRALFSRPESLLA